MRWRASASAIAVAAPTLVRELIKVKDSYNCDVLSLAAATAALEDQEYLQATRARILATRARWPRRWQNWDSSFVRARPISSGAGTPSGRSSLSTRS